MPAPLRLTLTAEENITLKELSIADGVPRRTRLRAHILHLLAAEVPVEKVAKLCDCAPSSVRSTYHRWQARGLMGLWDQPRSGRNPSWNQQDWEYLQSEVEQPRRYSARQLQEKLAANRQVNLGVHQIRRILKKKGIAGKGCVRLHQSQPNPN